MNCLIHFVTFESIGQAQVQEYSSVTYCVIKCASTYYEFQIRTCSCSFLKEGQQPDRCTCVRSPLQEYSQQVLLWCVFAEFFYMYYLSRYSLSMHAQR